MTASAEHTIRPPERTEAGTIATFLNELSREQHGVDDVTAAEIETWFDAPELSPEEDFLVAEAPGGGLLAYADMSDQGDRHRRFWVDLRLRDEEAGLALLREFERRATALAAPGALLRSLAAASDTRARRVLERAGLAPVRHSFRMEIELGESRPHPRWPEGIAVRTMEPGGDETAVYDVQNETFEDAWEYEPDPYAEWEHWNLRRGQFDPALWFLAEEGGEIAGIALCLPSDAEPELGWVSILGVRRPWRRRGLGQALLEHALAEFARRGFRRAGLGVDADSPTGAVGLYERAGMQVSRRYVIVEKEVSP